METGTGDVPDRAMVQGEKRRKWRASAVKVEENRRAKRKDGGLRARPGGSSPRDKRRTVISGGQVVDESAHQGRPETWETWGQTGRFLIFYT
jgi:hypothetical protein